MAHTNSDNSFDPNFFDIDLLFQALMENLADSIYFKDRQSRLMRVSRRLANSLGIQNMDEIIGKTDVELFGEEFGEKTRAEEQRIMETGEPVIGHVENFDRPDGSKNWTLTSKLPLKNNKGEIFGLFGITREINELKKVESDLQFLATHDVLTSLPNRYLLFDRLDQAILRAQRNGTIGAILFIDLDGFKKINDTHGHAFGDLLLVKVAEQLKNLIRDLDTVARIGGDEFVVVLEQLQSEEEARQITARIVDDIGKGIDIDSLAPPVTVSVGISLFPRHGTEIVKLLQRADNAMYLAKEQKNTFRVFDQTFNSAVIS
ncbi:MAG: GGDEF domain-containing protein [Leptolinea sp.]|nr:GGDEF domain-containing protein [Leptolinea sp.]